MKPITTIVLAALLLVCIVVALFTSDLFDWSDPADPDKAKEVDVFEPACGKPMKLIVEGEGGKFVFEKTGDDWKILEPVAAGAQNWRVNDVADPLEGLKGRSVEEADETTGLSAPIWTVTAVDGEKRTHKLLIGRPRPLQTDQTYVRPAGSKQTFLVKVNFAEKLDRPLSEYRDDTVLDLKTDEMARVNVIGQISYELVKRDGKWGIVHPISAAADEDAVKKVLDELGSLNASQFVTDTPGDLEPYGLKQPTLLATVEMQPEEPASKPATTQPASAPAPKPGKKHSLAVGKPVGDKLYAKLVDQPTVFKINKSVVENLQPKVVDLRVKKVLSLAADEVAGVLVELTDATASLVKVEDQWQMIAPQKGQAENNAVSDLLNDVADLKAENFKDEVAALSVYGLDKPAGKLTFRLAGKDETVTLLIGGQSPSGEMTFVKSATGVAVAVVRTADAKKLLAPPATYWDRTILKLPDEASVTRLQLRRTDGTYTLARDANDKWALLTPIAAEADTDQVNKVIDKLEDLAADKIVSVGPDVPEAYAKSADTMQVVVTSETAAPEPASKPATQPATQATRPATRPTTKPTTQASQPTTTKPVPKPIVAQHQITVAKVGLHAYAWAAGGKIVAVGEFAPNLYDDLVGGLRGKKIWTIVPDEIRALKAVAGTDSLELKKDGKAWKYTADAYVKIDAEKVTKHLDEDLKELTATKFVTHAAAGDLKKYGLDKPWLRLTLTDAKGKTWALTVSHTGESKTKDRYATASTVPGVFVLAADTIDKLGKKLKDFKKE